MDPIVTTHGSDSQLRMCEVAEFSSHQDELAMSTEPLKFHGVS